MRASGVTFGTSFSRCQDLARQPGGEELAETMDELERLNSALAQKAQDAKLAGKELCSDQEAWIQEGLCP